MVETLKLSNKAIEDLRTALKQSYGENFDAELTDEDIHQIGELFLVGVAAYLKKRVSTPELITNIL